MHRHTHCVALVRELKLDGLAAMRSFSRVISIPSATRVEAGDVTNEGVVHVPKFEHEVC